MIYLLSDEGRDALRRVAERAALYVFDFDGVLAKSSSDRKIVRLLPTMHEWLRELARRAPCAIVSGRSLDDLRPRLNGVVPYVIGSHGVEHPLASDAVLKAAEQLCLEWVNQVEGPLAAPLKDACVEVERKRYHLTLHYRGNDTQTKMDAVLAHLANQLIPAGQLVSGTASVSVLPTGTTRKVDAVLALMTRLRRKGVVFVGGDGTDPDVIGLKDGLIMGVRVGYRAESHARYYLKYQHELEEAIRFLVHRIDGTPDIASQVLRRPGGTIRV